MKNAVTVTVSGKKARAVLRGLKKKSLLLQDPCRQNGRGNPVCFILVSSEKDKNKIAVFPFWGKAA